MLTPKQREVVLKGPVCGRHSSHARGWVIGGGILTVLGGWVVFALVIMSGSGARNLGNGCMVELMGHSQVACPSLPSWF